jgi:hypothetical protein
VVALKHETDVLLVQFRTLFGIETMNRLVHEVSPDQELSCMPRIWSSVDPGTGAQSKQLAFLDIHATRRST